MLLCNTTFCVDNTIDNAFRSWVKDTLIPAATASGTFSSPLFTRIIADADPNAQSYALQLHAADHDAAARWHGKEAQELMQALRKIHGQDKVLSFVTFMEIL